GGSLGGVLAPMISLTESTSAAALGSTFGAVATPQVRPSGGGARLRRAASRLMEDTAPAHAEARRQIGIRREARVTPRVMRLPNESRLSCGALKKKVSFNILRAPPASSA